MAKITVKNMFIRQNIITVMLCLWVGLLFSQSPKPLSISKIDEEFTNRDFVAAFNHYSFLLKQDEKNQSLNFKLALSYHYLMIQPKVAARLFKNSLTSADSKYEFYNNKKTNAAIDAYYYLGKTHLALGQTDTAINYFILYLNKAGEQKLDAAKQLLMCANNKTLALQPRALVIKGLGDTINSTANDGNPVVSIDNKTLFFSSRRNTKSDTGIVMADEDIYISTASSDGNWRIPVPFAYNTPADEEPLYITTDGNKLYLRRVSAKTGGDIYFSEKKDGVWSNPIKMAGDINTGYDEKGIAFSTDGKWMVVSSNRPGTGAAGGYDLYLAESDKNGKWSKLKNMGDHINTKLNEIYPFFHPTEKRLYFSSNGNTRYGMGGYDILFSQKDSISGWSEPFTMGYPVNTGGNELSYYLAAGNKQYYSALNTEGDFDIFQINSGAFEAPVAEQLTEVTGVQETQVVELMEVEKEKKVEVQKDVEVEKIQEVEKEVEKNVGYVTADEAKKLDKVTAVEEKEVMVETPVDAPAVTTPEKESEKVTADEKRTDAATAHDKPANKNDVTEKKKEVNRDKAASADLANPVMHTVKAGETLYGISKEYNVSSGQLWDWNKLTDNNVKKGQSLIVGYQYTDELKDLLASKELEKAGVDKSDRETVIANIKQYYAHQVSQQESTVFGNIYFDFNSKELSLSLTELRILFDFLKEHKDVNIEVVGHTDNVGSWESNFWISRERAKSVYDYLILKGISPSRIIFNGKGSINPSSANDTKEGRAKNRRVEILLLQ